VKILSLRPTQKYPPGLNSGALRERIFPAARSLRHNSGTGDIECELSVPRSSAYLYAHNYAQAVGFVSAFVSAQHGLSVRLESSRFIGVESYGAASFQARQRLYLDACYTTTALL
jgi:hypothetical protein